MAHPIRNEFTDLKFRVDLLAISLLLYSTIRVNISILWLLWILWLQKKIIWITKKMFLTSVLHWTSNLSPACLHICCTNHWAINGASRVITITVGVRTSCLSIRVVVLDVSFATVGRWCRSGSGLVSILEPFSQLSDDKTSFFPTAFIWTFPPNRSIHDIWWDVTGKYLQCLTIVFHGFR